MRFFYEDSSRKYYFVNSISAQITSSYSVMIRIIFGNHREGPLENEGIRPLKQNHFKKEDRLPTSIFEGTYLFSGGQWLYRTPWSKYMAQSPKKVG